MDPGISFKKREALVAGAARASCPPLLTDPGSCPWQMLSRKCHGAISRPS